MLHYEKERKRHMNKKSWMSPLPIVFFALIFFLSIEQHQVSSYDEQRVLVIFHEQINESLLEEVNAVVHHRFETIASVAISIESAKLPKVKNHPDTLLVEEDHVVEIEYTISEKQWPLESTKVPISWENNYRGDGIKIAIIDTGVDKEHPDLSIKDGACFNTGVKDGCENSFQDDNGHGTHVAGIIGAYNREMPYFGVVPEATIYAIKAMDAEGKGISSDIVKSIEWAIEKEVDIINLSLSTENDSTLLRLAIEKAYDQGILVVAAAGNKGNRSGSGESVEYPAKYDTVIGVASVNDRHRRSHFSATGKEVEIAAPGERIYSTFPLTLDEDGNPNGYAYHSGTSMAAPYVTGILALYKQQNPNLSHKEIRELLQKNAYDLGQEGRDPLFGYGLIQAKPGIVLPAPTFHAEQTELGNVVLYWEAVENALLYQVFKNGQLIAETEKTELMKWLVKGNYELKIIAIAENGKISDASEQVIIEVTSIDYKDLKNGSWYTPHMIYLSKRSIITGFPDQTLRPYESVTRAQAVTMLGRALGFEVEKTETVFEDVDPDSFAAGFIQQAYEQKIVTGFPDDTFRPNQPVTRAEMAILIERAYQFNDEVENIFKDVTEDMQAYKAINRVAVNKISIGFDDGTFRPQDHMNRLQFAVFIARAEQEIFR